MYSLNNVLGKSKKGAAKITTMEKGINLQVACNIFSSQTGNIHQFKNSFWYSLCKGNQKMGQALSTYNQQIDLLLKYEYIQQASTHYKQ